MRTRVARTIIVVLTLLIGVAIAAELLFFFRPSKKPGVYLVKPVGPIILNKPKPVAHACGGSYYSYITSYEAPDGVMIFKSCAPFSSPSQAKRGLRGRLKDAISVIERGVKYNHRGREVGERAVAFFNSKEEGKKVALVLWTDDEDMYEVESFSLSHALEFERTYFTKK
jgi:hypothetical protein